MTIFNPYLWIGIALACLLSFFGGCQKGKNIEAASHAATLTKIAEATARAQELAHKAAQDYHTDLDAARAETRKEFTDALAIQDGVTAALRNGNQQLRKQWQGCVNRRYVPGDVESGAPADAGADLREAGAGRLIGAGAEADAWIRGLQRELTAAYQLCGKK
jgi:hypothetical protein